MSVRLQMRENTDHDTGSDEDEIRSGDAHYFGKDCVTTDGRDSEPAPVLPLD